MVRPLLCSLFVGFVVVACGDDASSPLVAPLPDGSVIADAGPAVMDSGSDDAVIAVPGCVIEGTAHAAGEADPANACQRCDPARSTTAWSLLADGASCGAGRLCAGGACGARCFIAGALRDTGAAHPENDCQECRPDASTTSWSTRETVPLLVGGTDPATQGWATVSLQPSTAAFADDHVRLTTSTATGARTSGQLLLTKAAAVPTDAPFGIRIVLQIEAADRHNTLDSGAAILGSFTGPAGNAIDRAEMIYLESDRIGWADDSGSFAASVIDGAYHTLDLVVEADRKATVRFDGAVALTRNAFSTTGTIAIGDQTNDAKVDGTMRVRSVAKLCPAPAH